MTRPVQQQAQEHQVRRTWAWWLRFVFASFGIAVGLLILFTVVLLPITGISRLGAYTIDQRQYALPVLVLVGCIISYRHLK